MAKKRFDPTRTTLLQASVAKVGPSSGRRVVFFVLLWRDVRADLGHDITMAEFIRETGTAERTAFNWLTTFRQVFDGAPGLTPNDVLQVHDAVEFERLTGFGQVATA